MDRKVRLDEVLVLSGWLSTPDGYVFDFMGGGSAIYGRSNHMIVKHTQREWWETRRWSGDALVRDGARLRGITIVMEPPCYSEERQRAAGLLEPEDESDVTPAPQPETAIMDNEAAIRTAADLLERVTSLAAVIAERASDVHKLEAVAVREHSIGGLQSLAGELIGDIMRAKNMAEAAATILAEMRSRG